MMKVKGNIIITIVFLSIGLYGIITSLSFKYWESMTLPLISSSLIFVLASTQLGLDLRKYILREAKSSSNKANSEKLTKPEFIRAIKILAWIAGFCLSLYVLGFYISVPVFSFTYLKIHSRGWINSISFAAIITCLVYIIFNVLLKTMLYRGLFFSIF